MALNCCLNLKAALKNIYGAMRQSAELFIAIPHPCFNTSHTEWKKDTEGQMQGMLLKSYFHTEAQTRKWDFSKNIKNRDSLNMEEIRSYWTLSDLLNEILSNKFQIVKILEPIPSQEAIKQNPRLKRWSEDAALFLFIHCKK